MTTMTLSINNPGDFDAMGGTHWYWSGGIRVDLIPQVVDPAVLTAANCAAIAKDVKVKMVVSAGVLSPEINAVRTAAVKVARVGVGDGPGPCEPRADGRGPKTIDDYRADLATVVAALIAAHG